MPTPPYRILFPEEWRQEPSQLQPITVRHPDIQPQEDVNHPLPRISQQDPIALPNADMEPTSHLSQTDPIYPQPIATLSDRLLGSSVAVPWEISVAGMQPASPLPATTTSLFTSSEASFQQSSFAPSSAVQPATRNEIEEILDKKLAALRVYVLESDITETQLAVKSVVELASF